MRCNNPLNNFETISGKFPGAEKKLLQTDVDEGRNNFILHETTTLVCSEKL